jgi:hypothetical protein
MEWEDEVRAAVAHSAITRLQAAYGDAVTRRAWDELGDMFVPGCPVRLDLRRGEPIETTGPDGIARFIERAVERFEFFAFTVVNAAIEVAPDAESAGARLYIRELRQGRGPDGGWSTAYGLYRDTYARDPADGRWRFASRDYATLARSADEAAGTGQMVTFPVP